MALRRAAPSHTKTLKSSHKRGAPDDSSDRAAKRTDLGTDKPVNIQRSKTARHARTQALDLVLNRPPQTRLQVYVCGEGSAGELGLGPKNATNVKTPRVNPNLAGVLGVATGGMHAAALTADNKILTWGINDLCTLGRDTTWDGGERDIDEDSSSESEADMNPKESTPTAVPSSSFPPGTEFVQVAAGDSSTFALTDKGLVYGWGTFRDNNGVYGFTLDPDTHEIVKIQKKPLLIPGLKKITQLSVGADFALALDTTGHVFAWGCGQQCELGHHLLERRRPLALLPSPLRLPRSAKIVSIHAAMNHAFAIDAKGDTWAWGSNNYAQTGSGLKAHEEGGTVAVVQRVRSLVGKNMKQVEGGSHHSVGVTQSGECLVWGRIDGGQLGLDMSTLPVGDPSKVLVDSRDKPRILLQPTPLSVSNCAYVASGSDHSLLVVSDGRVYSWGFNATYQCGQGTDDDILVAKKMNGVHIRDQVIVWAGAGGQYSMFASRMEGK